MFSNNKDLFDFINNLIKRLEDKNENYWSNEFRQALNMSFMPGELLGEVRKTLLEFQKTQLPKQMDLVNEIRTAIHDLDRALGR